MSRSVNRVQLLGRIGRDAETKQTTGDIAVSNFSLATNRSVKTKSGYKQQTDWHNIVVWRSENLGPYLTKGKQVFVEGRLQSKTWTDDSGQKRSRVEVVAENLILLSRDENGDGKTAAKNWPRRTAKTSELDADVSH